MPMDRSKKWKIKTDTELLTPRLDALHELSSEQIARTYQSIDAVYKRAEPILNKIGIIATARVGYRAYVQELWRICDKFTRKTRLIEATAVTLKYDMYGMDRQTLKDLAALFGLSVQTLDELGKGEVVMPYSFGLDALKPAAPAVGDLYFATDTKILYICNVVPNWTGVELD